ncbi:peroxidase 20 [Rhododendron vialii]|uniref:peroxidase 20 n=1 Tax=Rhododendron vialii TaxID=182163 RepID=UPI0026603872|nr:peroxidase 20 [Rhododendron vialii]
MVSVLLIALLVLILHGCGSLSDNGPLDIDYYKERCPHLEQIVQRNVEIAVLREPRMAASLLRLHFHDCFVLGCDASVLLDNSGSIVSEKQAGPNKNSLRGFDVIDEIKHTLEEACPLTVSCADIVALVARDAVVLRGGHRWDVHFGRRDSIKASLDDANKFLPAPNSSLEILVANFQQHGLDTLDLVALSGSHTIGKSRCFTFRQGIYQDEEKFHLKRDTTYQEILRSLCPKSGKDDKFAPLDSATPARFDNLYYHNIIQGQGLLISDNVLVSEDVGGDIRKHVWNFANDQDFFFHSFGNSMIKMGSINVLTGEEGEIRRNCRFVNTK